LRRWQREQRRRVAGGTQRNGERLSLHGFGVVHLQNERAVSVADGDARVGHVGRNQVSQVGQARQAVQRREHVEREGELVRLRVFHGRLQAELQRRRVAADRPRLVGAASALVVGLDFADSRAAVAVDVVAVVAFQRVQPSVSALFDALFGDVVPYFDFSAPFRVNNLTDGIDRNGLFIIGRIADTFAFLQKSELQLNTRRAVRRLRTRTGVASRVARLTHVHSRVEVRPRIALTDGVAQRERVCALRTVQSRSAVETADRALLALVVFQKMRRSCTTCSS
jgi:hypothetical protein